MKLVSLAIAVLLFTARCSLVCMARGHETRDEPHVDTAGFTRVAEANPLEVHRIGSGPPLILLHEVPGTGPHFVELAKNLAAEGYTVYAPVFFGTFGHREGKTSLVKRCASRDWNCVGNTLSRAAEDLEKTVDVVRALHKAQDIGVIGMCLTGNLPLAVASEANIGAVVLAQPALPIASGPLVRKIGLTEAQIAEAKSGNVPMLTFGFTEDCIAPPERLQALKDVFGEQLRVLPVEVEDEKDAFRFHAVLTDALHHPNAVAACKEMVRLLDERVKHGANAQGGEKACRPSTSTH